MKLPQEIIDKIFLSSDYETIIRTRQLIYVKRCTEFLSFNFAKNKLNIEWLFANPSDYEYITITINKWLKKGNSSSYTEVITL